MQNPKQPIPLPRHELQPSHRMELMALRIITGCPADGMTLKPIADMSTDNPAACFPEAKALFGLIILNSQHTCNARINQAVQPPEPAMPAQPHPAAAMKTALLLLLLPAASSAAADFSMTEFKMTADKNAVFSRCNVHQPAPEPVSKKELPFSSKAER